jgi:hypothetical protein
VGLFAVEDVMLPGEHTQFMEGADGAGDLFHDLGRGGSTGLMGRMTR